MKLLLSLSALVLLGVSPQPARAYEIYVSPSGSDSNPGTSGQPLATLIGARDTLRSRRSSGQLPNETITVYLRGGYYNQPATATFTSADSGRSSAPVVYTSAPGEQAYVTGAVTLDPSWFNQVNSSSPIWGRLDPAARGQVYAVDLRSHGIGNWGNLQPRGFSLRAPAPLELSCNGQAMTLARWPNVGAPLAYTASAQSSTLFTYSGDRPSRWTQASDIWMHGFWNQNYADYHVPVGWINPSGQSINLAQPPVQFGLASDRPYYAYNLLEELDTPGEYYLDRSSGILYFWPPSGLSGAVLEASMLESPVIACAGTSYLNFRGLIIEASRGPLVTLTDGDHNQIQHCLLRNGGEYGVFISGSNNGLDHCQVAFCGEEGVRIQGGDRSSLTSGNNYVSNSQIHAIGQVGWGYRPAVTFEEGCGNSATHNLIDDLPHAAILFAGNNHLIAFNEIQRVCQLTSDSGAIYADRNWSYRGNVIENNYLHDVASTLGSASANGVYLDDCMSGVTVHSNIFYQVSGTALFCGGGRDNLMTNNIVALSGTAHFDDDRGMVRITNNGGDSWNLLAGLQSNGIAYQQWPWSNQYPAAAALPNSWNQLQQGQWRDPQNSVFSSNAGWSNFAWAVAGNYAGTPVFGSYASMSNNNESISPLFGAGAALDRSQRAGSLTAPVSGFAPVAFSAIGPDTSNLPAPLSAPPAPQLKAQPASASQVSLDWSTLQGLGKSRPDGFAVQQSASSNGPWSTVQSFGSEVDYASIGGLSAGTAYSFRVVASNGLGSSSSNVVTVGTDPAPPVAVSVSRIEAESPLNVVDDLRINGTVGVSKGQLDSGDGSVRMYDVGDEIQINFSVPSTGLYRLGLRTRSGGGTGPTGFWPSGYLAQLDNVPLPVVGDSSTVSAYDPSFGGSFWGTMISAPLTLSAGNHSVRVTADMTWTLVDYLEVTTLAAAAPVAVPPPVQAAPTPAPTPAPSSPATASAAAPTQIEAESQFSVVHDVGQNGTIGVSNGNLDSGGSVRMYDPGDAIQINFTTPSAGSYQIGVRARSGGVTGSTGYWPNGYTAVLDGAPVTLAGDPNSLSELDPSYGGAYWGTMNSGFVTLGGGSHSLVITSNVAWAVIDYVRLTPQTMSPGATVTRFEAESPLNVLNDVNRNGTVGAAKGQLDSGGSVRMYDPGDAIQINFTVPAGGSYQLGLRARTGGSTGMTGYWPSGYQAKVDGGAVGLSLDQNSISGWDSAYGGCYWGTMTSSPLNLTAGGHSLVVTSQMAWAVVDYVEVTALATSSGGVIRIEAETPLTVINDVRSNGTVGVSKGGLDSGGSVRMYDVGDAIQINFTTAASGTYQLNLRARSGGSTGSAGYWPNGYQAQLDGRPLGLNGDSNSISGLDSSYGGAYWGTLGSGPVTLSAGNHSLIVTSKLAWAVVDYLEVVAPVAP
jgi:hypothetical protein